jgi:hypothetical protein
MEQIIFDVDINAINILSDGWELLEFWKSDEHQIRCVGRFVKEFNKWEFQLEKRKLKEGSSFQKFMNLSNYDESVNLINSNQLPESISLSLTSPDNFVFSFFFR